MLRAAGRPIPAALACTARWPQAWADAARRPTRSVQANEYRRDVDSIDDATLVKVLTDACNAASGADFESIVSVASALRRAAGTDEDPVQALIAGLEYHLVLATDTRTPNGPFGPMIEARGKRHPASLDRIEELVPGTVDLWRRAASMAPLSSTIL